MPRLTSARLAGLLLLLAALALYLATLTDSLTPGELRGGDPITHMYAQVEGRFSNAPGYPVFIMGGWLWFHIFHPLLAPWVNPVQILSAYCTFWAILALAALYTLLRYLTADDWPIALLITAFYAVSYFFWFYAVSVEEYSSAVLQQVLLIGALMRWDDSGRRRDLLLVALLGGLSLAHMVTVAVIAPAVLWFIFTRRPELLRQPKLLLAVVGASLLPLLSYLYVYLVGQAHPEWRGAGTWSSTLAWFIDFVSTHQGQSELTWKLGPFTSDFPSLIGRELTGPMLILGLIGLAYTGRRRAIFFYATLVIYFILCYIDRYGNWFQVIMPAYPVILIGAAVLCHRLRLVANEHLGRQAANGVYAGTLLILMGLTGYRYVLSEPQANRHARPGATALQSGWEILADDPAPGAGIVAPVDESLALQFLTHIYGVRPDLRPLSTGEAQQWLLTNSGRVYALNSAIPLVMREISPDIRLSDHGRWLVELRLTPETATPEMQIKLDREPIPGLHLLGYDVLHRAPHGVDLHLFWQATQKLSANASISVRPLHNGEFIWNHGTLVQQDRPNPVNGQYPFSRWQAGEVVRDDYELELPDDVLADGAAVILYQPTASGFDNLADVRFTLP